MKRLLFVIPNQGNPSSYSSIYFIVSLSRIPSLAAYQLARLTSDGIDVEIADKAIREAQA